MKVTLRRNWRKKIISHYNSCQGIGKETIEETIEEKKYNRSSAFIKTNMNSTLFKRTLLEELDFSYVAIANLLRCFIKQMHKCNRNMSDIRQDDDELIRKRIRWNLFDNWLKK